MTQYAPYSNVMAHCTMEKVIINILVLLFITSCSLDKKKPETEKIIPSEEFGSAIAEQPTKGNTLTIELEPQTTDSLLSFFELLELESLKVTAKNNTYTSYSEQEEIPFRYQTLFDGYLYPMGRTSTGYLPKNYFQISDSLAFLIIFIQDGYGPLYHGLVYNSVTNKIFNSQVLAREWGDAGDSQTIYSNLEQQERTLTVNKFITTCHAELDFDSDPVKVISEECFDSTYVATIK